MLGTIVNSEFAAKSSCSGGVLSGKRDILIQLFVKKI